MYYKRTSHSNYIVFFANRENPSKYWNIYPEEGRNSWNVIDPGVSLDAHAVSLEGFEN